MPVTRKSCKRYLSAAEIHKLLMALDGRDRSMARTLIVRALRPGELFALRWRNVQEGRLKIEGAVYHGELGPTKTDGSTGLVAIPGSLRKELELWRESCSYPNGGEFVFPSRKGTPLDAHNYLRLNTNSKCRGL